MGEEVNKKAKKQEEKVKKVKKWVEYLSLFESLFVSIYMYQNCYFNL